MNATVGVGTTSVLGHSVRSKLECFRVGSFSAFIWSIISATTRAMILCIECSIYPNVDSEAAKSRVTGPEKASNPISGL